MQAAEFATGKKPQSGLLCDDFPCSVLLALPLQSYRNRFCLTGADIASPA